VSVIILNYNGKDLLRRCLQSVAKTKYVNFEVIIVDNASTDESCRMVEKEYPTFRLLKNGSNCGYSTGNNLGILDCKGEFIALLNNDTVVSTKWLSELVRHAKMNPLCFYQPKIMFLGSNRINSAGNLIQLFGFAFPRGIGEVDLGQYNEVEEVSYASGACVLGSKTLIEEIGLLDEEGFFSFYEDVNWGWRTLLHGHKTIYLPTATVYHKWGGSWGQSMSRTKFFLIERSRIASIIRNYSFKTIVILLPGIVIIEFALILYSTMKGLLREKIRVYADLLRLRSYLISQREIIQSKRVVSDFYVHNHFCDGLLHVYLGAFGKPVDKILSFITKLIKSLL
jgi:GT2 family glycosyltransferase